MCIFTHKAKQSERRRDSVHMMVNDQGQWEKAIRWLTQLIRTVLSAHRFQSFGDWQSISWGGEFKDRVSERHEWVLIQHAASAICYNETGRCIIQCGWIKWETRKAVYTDLLTAVICRKIDGRKTTSNHKSGQIDVAWGSSVERTKMAKPSSVTPVY